ncbi:MAG: hypothetical protein ABIK62_01925, partial [candidate division WOR-3 bacterium]
QRDASEFHTRFRSAVVSTASRGGAIYFVNLFNRPPHEIKRSYVERLKFPEFPAFLENLRLGVVQISCQSESGTSLYQLMDTTSIAFPSLGLGIQKEAGSGLPGADSIAKWLLQLQGKGR